MHYTWDNLYVININLLEKLNKVIRKLFMKNFLINKDRNFNWNFIELSWPLANIG